MSIIARFWTYNSITGLYLFQVYMQPLNPTAHNEDIMEKLFSISLSPNYLSRVIVYHQSTLVMRRETDTPETGGYIIGSDLLLCTDTNMPTSTARSKTLCTNYIFQFFKMEAKDKLQEYFVHLKYVQVLC